MDEKPNCSACGRMQRRRRPDITPLVADILLDCLGTACPVMGNRTVVTRFDQSMGVRDFVPGAKNHILHRASSCTGPAANRAPGRERAFLERRERSFQTSVFGVETYWEEERETREDLEGKEQARNFGRRH